MNPNRPYSIQLLNDLHNHFPDLLYHSNRFQNVQDVLEYISQIAEENSSHIQACPYHPHSSQDYMHSPFSSYTSSMYNPLYSSSFYSYMPGYNSRYYSSNTNGQRQSQQQTTNRPTTSSSSRSVSSTTTSSSSSSRPVSSTTSSSSSSRPVSSTASSSASSSSTQSSSSLPLSSGLSSSSRIRFTMPLQSSNQANRSNSQDELISNLIMGVLGSALMSGSNSSSSSMYSYENFLQPVTVRPTQNQIDSATYTMILQSNSQDNCAICQDPMEAQQEIRIIDHCGHSFHKNCIDPWFNENVRCPTCRYDIRGNSSSSSSPADRV